MQRPALIRKLIYIVMGVAVIFSLALFLIANPHTADEFPEAINEPIAKPMGEKVYAEWMQYNIEGFGYVAAMGGDLISGDSLRLRFDPTQGCQKAELFTTFMISSGHHIHSLENTAPINLNVAIAGFGDEDRFLSVPSMIIDIADLGMVKTAIVSLGLRDAEEWKNILSGIFVRITLDDGADPIAKTFEYAENAWDIGLFEKGASEAQSLCFNDLSKLSGEKSSKNSPHNLSKLDSNKPPQIFPSEFMSVAESRVFGSWTRDWFSRQVINKRDTVYRTNDATYNSDEWSLEFFDNIGILVMKTGQITYGDRLRFRVNPKHGCNEAEMITSYYSTGLSPNFFNLKDKTIGFDLAVSDPQGDGDRTLEVGGDVIVAETFLLGHRATLTFSYMPVEFWAIFLDGDTASLTMKEANGISPEDYFDITQNSWSMNGFAEKLRRAAEICRGSKIVDPT